MAYDWSIKKLWSQHPIVMSTGSVTLQYNVVANPRYCYSIVYNLAESIY